jgi:hypothetical protein
MSVLIVDKTCGERVEKVLRAGGWWTNMQVHDEILRRYGREYQNNTIAKELSFLQNRGVARSVRDKGATFERYTYVESTPQVAQVVPIQADRLCDACGQSWHRVDGRCNRCGHWQPATDAFYGRSRAV